MYKIQMVKLATMTKQIKKHPCGCFLQKYSRILYIIQGFNQTQLS